MKKLIITTFLLCLGSTGMYAMQGQPTAAQGKMLENMTKLPAYFAAQNKSAEALRVVGKLPGALLNYQDEALGRTALHYAAEKGYTTLAEALVHKGADSSIRDGAGQTALDLARENHSDAIVQLLETK